MSEKVEYELSLKDLFTEKLNAAKEAAKGFGEVMETTKKIVEAFGINASFLNPAEFIKGGVEGIHKLHQAEEQLQNAMANTGTYSKEAYEKMIEGADKLSEHTNYSKAEIIEMQGHLALVGRIGKDKMDDVTKATVDLAATMKIKVSEAGDMMTRVMNDPRLVKGFTGLGIPPAVLNDIKKLAEGGDAAGARLQILDAIQHRVKNSAKEAFESNPAAEFNKFIEKAQLTVGQLALEIVKVVMPAFQWFEEKIKDVVDGVRSFSIWLDTNKNTIRGVAEIVGTLTGAVITFIAWQKLCVLWTERQAIWDGMLMIAKLALIIATVGAVVAVEALTVGFGSLTAAIAANPIGAIAITLIAVAAALYEAYENFESFHAAVWGAWGALKTVAAHMSNAFMGLGKLIEGVFTLNPSKIKAGYQDIANSVKDIGSDISKAYNEYHDKGIADFKAKHEKKKTAEKTEDSHVINGVPDVKDGVHKNVPPPSKAGGAKSVTINIAINKQIETLNIKTSNLVESASRIQERVAEALTNAVNQSQIIAGGR